MLMLRLSPTGKKNQKFFRIIVSEKTKDVFGTYLELLGNYNPHKSPPEVNLKVDRIKHWLAKGAQASPTVHNLLVDQKILTVPKLTSWKPKKKKGDEPAAQTEGDKKPEAAAEKPKEPAAEKPADVSTEPAKEAPAEPPVAAPAEPAKE